MKIKKTGNTPEEQRQYKREYMRKWCAEHREHLSEYKKKRRLEHPEIYKQYYEKNKEKIYESNSKWRKNHKKEFAELVAKARKARVECLRAQGCTNAWMVVSQGAEPKFEKGGGINDTNR